MASQNLGVLSGGYSVDQGVDFSGQGVIPALAPATVTDIGQVHIIEGGSYPYVVYKLNGGPHRGQYVYLMESFTPTVHVGERLKAGQAVGVRQSGKNPSPDVGIEIGFNKTPQGVNPIAPLYPNPHSPKAAGYVMSSYINSLRGSGSVTAQKNPPDLLTGWKNIPQSDKPKSALFYPGDPTSGVFGAVGSVGDALGFLFSIRGLQTIGGGIIMLMGLYLLAKQVGLRLPAPGPIKAAANSASSASPIGPSENPTGEPPRRTIRNVYYLDAPRGADARRAKPLTDPATSDIGF